MIWLPTIQRIATPDEAYQILNDEALNLRDYQLERRMTREEARMNRYENRKANQKLFWLWDNKLIRLPEGWR